MRFEKIQLIFPRHTAGNLAHDGELQEQPPLGLMALAGYLGEVHPEVEVEIFDGKGMEEEEILSRIDAPLVGLSTWFSNYTRAKAIAAELKRRDPSRTVVMGGPHATPQARKILQCDSNVDFVVQGEGELAFAQLVEGVPAAAIPGLAFRSNSANEAGSIRGISTAPTPDINALPLPAAHRLSPTYEWTSRPDGPAMSAFPFSGIRGCTRRPRCEYCAIPTGAARVMRPERYWEQVKQLHESYGIDYFFETGDIFPPRYLREVANSDKRIEVSFRIYAYPGLLKLEHLSDLVGMGVHTVFIGVESHLIWSRSFRRKYPTSHSPADVVEELRAYGSEGIRAIPAFLLGLPGETEASVAQNLSYVSEIASLQNVRELTMSVVLPLPGSHYFRMCEQDQDVVDRYFALTGEDLREVDDVDVYLLSDLFVNRFSSVDAADLRAEIDGIRKEVGPGFATWGPQVDVRTNGDSRP